MALIAMAVYDTDENGRSEYTDRTLDSLISLLMMTEHRLVIVDNGSCKRTKDTLNLVKKYGLVTLITNPTNVGTAAAINQAWRLRRTGEHLIKMDNDCIVNSQEDWVKLMEAAIERDPQIGIIGLKRKDLLEDPNRPEGDWMRSELISLPHKAGEAWINVEKVNHVMGTCQMFNHRLIEKIGGLYQMEGIYGFDDSLAAVRCQLAGFYNCFLPHIDIDHIDRGDSPYQKEKEAYAGAMMSKYNETKAAMMQGTMGIYFPI